MNAPNLKLQIEDFQAINSACIELDSVTVLSGPPGSGKTNLLNFTSQLLNSLLMYDVKIREKPFEEMLSVEKNLYELVQSLPWDDFRIEMKNPYKRNGYPKKSYWIRLVDFLDYTYQKNRDQPGGNKKLYHYNPPAVAEMVKKMEIAVDYSEVDFKQLIRHLRKYQKKIFHFSDERIKKRPYENLKEIFKESFDKKTYPSRFELLQYGQFIVGNSQPSIGKIKDISKIYYVMKEGRNDWLSHYIHTFPVTRRNKMSTEEISFHEMNDLMAVLQEVVDREILNLKGSVKKESVFSEEFALTHCDAGLKTFLTFYRLVRRRQLNDQTLIIFDQPETYLKPDQVSRLIRLVCLLYCRLGVRFLFSTNDPEISRTFAYASREYPLGRGFRLYEGRQGRHSYSYDYHQIG